MMQGFHCPVVCGISRVYMPGMNVARLIKRIASDNYLFVI
ncbi:hypothetical protein EV03_0220 [Prochlorococcus marinus str. PAC1]|uniref:Uncharacterized protein n=1 Tax=Prochlorococcus marinus str. PAC1 TaxID=59924 RepID=A0A0A2C6A7_PROMR|nr:hypothetical protein EV03_0220 [Prochlorococcus marinus str. PAC1]